MRVLHAASELLTGNRSVCLAIGFFDGVHLGHQEIIRRTVADARQHDGASLVITFDKHPNAIVAPERVPPLIYSAPQRCRAIESLGTDALMVIRFDEAFSQQSGETFIRGLAQGLRKIQSICVGADFVFGHKRSGNVALLERVGMEIGFRVHGLPAVSLEGEPVSSTRIREAIRAGDFDFASRMLGRAYGISGKIIRGDRLGHQLGFPTANLDVSRLILPPNGVYAARASVLGKSYRAVLNIGHRPTLKSSTPQTRFEVHLQDFSGELYDQEMEVTFSAKLRDEKKFASLDELKAQIVRDIADSGGKS